MITKYLIPFLLATFLVSCASETPTVISAPTLENDSIAQPISALPIESNATAKPTNSRQIEKWEKYENALALEVLQTVDAICEWDILGQDDSKVYVLAICQANNPEEGAMAAAGTPAVIQLGDDGEIERVQVPEDGVYIREMLPPEIQQIISEQSAIVEEEMWSHLHSRQENPEPPLIVLSGESLP